MISVFEKLADEGDHIQTFM